MVVKTAVRRISLSTVDADGYQDAWKPEGSP